MQVRFCGTRGSLAKPGTTTLRYGGNTLCTEVRTADGTLIVIDCGTGAHGLGQRLVQTGPTVGHLLITHTHWDHIQGFPFFAPLFAPGNEWHVYAPSGLGHRLEDTLAGQMEYTYFPVHLHELAAHLIYHDITEGELSIGNVRVRAAYMNHPTVTLGYRLEVGGASVVYASDHEPHSEHVHQPTNLPVHHEDQRHIEFLTGADLVIHDAQYTLEEYANRVGWGHCPMEKALEFAAAAGVRSLALFHHDPLRDDDSLDRLLERCRQTVADWGSPLRVFAAAEGAVLSLPEQTSAAPVDDAVHLPPQGITPKPSAITLLIADDDPTFVETAAAAFEADGFHVVTTREGGSLLSLVHDLQPSLLVLAGRLNGRSGVELCRLLRADSNPAVRSLPIVLVTDPGNAQDLDIAFSSGATDYMTKPLSPQQLQSRVHRWLLRRQRAGTGGAQGDTA